MADSLPIRSRPGRISATAPSSLAITGGYDADFESGIGSPIAGTTVDLDVMSPPKTPSALLLQRSYAHKSSVGSTESVSSTGSSIKTDSGFDPPVPSPFHDSPPTSPEEDSSTLAQNRRTPSRSPRSPHLSKAGYDAQQSPGSESPMAAVGKRRKSSSKSGILSSGPRRASRASGRLEALASERQRASSAPSIPPRTNSGSSRDNPICLSDDDQASGSLVSVMSKEMNDSNTSAKEGRAASAALKILTSKQRSRTSSAAGRVEGGDPSQRTEGDLNKFPERKDRNLSSAILPSTKPVDKSDPSIRIKKAQRPNSTTGSSSVVIEAPIERNKMPKDSLGASRSRSSRRIEISGSTAPVQEAKGGPLSKRPITGRRLSSVEKRPLKMPGDYFSIFSDTESQIDSPTDTENSALQAELGSPDDEAAESDQSSQLSEMDDISDCSDSGFESDASLETRNSDDKRSNGDTASAAHSANGEPRYPNFRKYSKKIYNEKDLRDRLERLMREKIEKKKSGKSKLGTSKHGKKRVRKAGDGKGDIYIYSATACQGYFKVGFTSRDIVDRIGQQKCGLGDLSRILDANQGKFRYANRVDSLIKRELHNLRWKFPCKRCKNGDMSKYHGEFYKTEVERVMDVTNKWRRWITMPVYNPYDSYGNLTPRWVWKLDRRDENKAGRDLDTLLQPFTAWEDLLYRRDWFTVRCKEIYTQGACLYTTLMESKLFLVTVPLMVFLVYSQGLQAGLGYFFLLAAAVGTIFSGWW